MMSGALATCGVDGRSGNADVATDELLRHVQVIKLPGPFRDDIEQISIGFD